MKNIFKMITIFICGILVSGFIVYAVDKINSNDIIYDNTTGLESTNVQDAIDEIYQLVDGNTQSIYDSSEVSISTRYKNDATTLEEVLDDLYTKFMGDE